MTIAYGISPRQIKAIHALVGRLGWDDELYRAVLKERFGVSTCKALSHARATLLIDELKVKAGQRPAGPPPRPVTARRAYTWPRQAEDRRLKAGRSARSSRRSSMRCLRGSAGISGGATAFAAR